VVDSLSQIPRIFSVIPLQMNLRENILTIKHDDPWYQEGKEFIGKTTMLIPKFERFIVDNDELLRFKSRI